MTGLKLRQFTVGSSPWVNLLNNRSQKGVPRMLLMLPLASRVPHCGRLLTFSVATLALWMVLTASSAASGPAVLTLTPSQGGGCLDVVARGENFEPGTVVTIIADNAPYGDSRTMLGEARVDGDGTFTFALPRELTTFIHCDDMPPPPAGDYSVTASTGQLAVGAGLREPSATTTFTRMLATADRFTTTWARTDRPVQVEQVSRTWVWGPGPVSSIVEESYAESPGGMREAQYSDKARMEINNPATSADTLWSVTNGLLVVEMVEGSVQTGDNTFDSSPGPAALPVAGDLDSPGITYAGINASGLRLAPALDEGVMITEQIDESGQVVDQKHLADYGVIAARVCSGDGPYGG